MAVVVSGYTGKRYHVEIDWVTRKVTMTPKLEMPVLGMSLGPAHEALYWPTSYDLRWANALYPWRTK